MTKIFKNDKKGYYYTLLENSEVAAKKRNVEIENKIERKREQIENSFVMLVLTKKLKK